MYDPTHGVFNVILEALGFDARQWLYDEKLALGAMIVMGVWKGVGYYMTLYLAGLNNIPGYLYEAASIDRGRILTEGFPYYYSDAASGYIFYSYHRGY